MRRLTRYGKRISSSFKIQSCQKDGLELFLMHNMSRNLAITKKRLTYTIGSITSNLANPKPIKLPIMIITTLSNITYHQLIDNSFSIHSHSTTGW